jgi:hypothetical protein
MKNWCNFRRACAVCGVRDIPYGVDWPVWVDSKPAHHICAEKLLQARRKDQEKARSR